MPRNRDRKRPPAVPAPTIQRAVPVVVKPVAAAKTAPPQAAEPPPSPPSHQTLSQSPRVLDFRLTRRDVVIALCLLLAVFAAFGQAIRFPFAELDDSEAVFNNLHIARGVSLD